MLLFVLAQGQRHSPASTAIAVVVAVLGGAFCWYLWTFKVRRR